MTKRSRLPWLIIGGIILLIFCIAAMFLSSPSPHPVTMPSPAIISSTDFVAPTVPRTPVLHGRNQRPEGPALIDPSTGHGQYLHSGRYYRTQGLCQRPAERGCLVPARVRAGPLPGHPVAIRLLWWRSLRMGLRVWFINGYCKFFLF